MNRALDIQDLNIFIIIDESPIHFYTVVVVVVVGGAVFE